MSNQFDAKDFLSSLTQRPGCYQMYAANGDLLYVGKARNLKNRVSSYFRSTGQTIKTQALVSKIANIEVTVTGSETEALLLEQNLIKNHRPPYNILLRDDKSYPYILVTDGEAHPAVRFQRGKSKRKGKLFGPFPSGLAVRDSLNLLQKLFKVRQCDDTQFRNRSRPCLQYQIERCSAPCVGLISEEDYSRDVRHTKMFLEGKNPAVLAELGLQMDEAAAALEFERAAELRDQLQKLRHVQEQQYVSGQKGDADVFGCAIKPGGVCVHALFVRQGRVIGSRVYHPKVAIEESSAEVLAAFVAQFYLAGGREIPATIITTESFESEQTLAQALSEERGSKVQLSANVRGERAAWQRLAQTNAEQNLTAQLANKQNMYNRFLALQEALNLEEVPTRLECFDISHSSGEATVASCVVFDRNGPLKRDYRKFNIEDITGGDDYAAMHQALERRYGRLQKEEALLPDLLVIDGGKGQVAQAMDVLGTLGLKEVRVIGIAKGPTRKAGFEVLIEGETGAENILQSDNLALHLLQHIRDEAHRFAITGHRARRAKARKQSLLEGIEGVGPKRRRALLNHFGSAKAVESASIEEIAKVSTISRSLAETIYFALHPEPRD
ncbi:MAG TPA: excinuclease ABC subunit UvrC [Marinobacterium sp.]|nr:excinuclease ABC subunit UvrC [Marinobacterium sp.]